MQRENVFGNKMQYAKVFQNHYPEDNYNDHCSSFLDVVFSFMNLKIILENMVWYNRKVRSKLF